MKIEWPCPISFIRYQWPIWFRAESDRLPVYSSPVGFGWKAICYLCAVRIHCRSVKIGSTWPPCWIVYSCGFSRRPFVWERPLLSYKLRRCTTIASRSISDCRKLLPGPSAKQWPVPPIPTFTRPPTDQRLRQRPQGQIAAAAQQREGDNIFVFVLFFLGGRRYLFSIVVLLTSLSFFLPNIFKPNSPHRVLAESTAHT